MTDQERATDRTLAVITATIEEAIEEIHEHTGADRCDILNDIIIGFIAGAKAVRRRLEAIPVHDTQEVTG